MYLQTAVAGRGATDKSGVNAHPDAKLADRLRPGVAAQRLLGGDRGLDRAARVDEVREQRVALAAVDMATRTLDGILHEPVVLGQEPRPQRTGRARQTRRALDVGEEHCHDTLWRLSMMDRPAPSVATAMSSRGVERRVVAQDRLLQALQFRRGLQSEL